MFKKNITTTAFILASLFASVTASAQTYVGATVGSASWSDGCATGGYSCRTNIGNSTAFKLLGGYEFSRHWGIEASYYNLGNVSTNYYYGPLEYKSSGIDVAAVVRFQFGKSNLSGFIRTGLASDHGQVSGNADFFAQSNRSIQPTVGLGLNYKFSDTLSGRFDIDSRHTRLSSVNNGFDAYPVSINFGLVTKF